MIFEGWMVGRFVLGEMVRSLVGRSLVPVDLSGSVRIVLPMPRVELSGGPVPLAALIPAELRGEFGRAGRRVVETRAELLRSIAARHGELSPAAETLARVRLDLISDEARRAAHGGELLWQTAGREFGLFLLPPADPSASLPTLRGIV